MKITNEQLIEFLTPALDRIAVGQNRYLNDVRIVLESQYDGRDRLFFRAYAQGDFIDADTLDALAEKVEALGPNHRLKRQAEELRSKLAEVEAQLAGVTDAQKEGGGE